MPLKPEIAKAILDARTSIYAQNFFFQADFENPTSYVRVVLPRIDRKNPEQSQRSVIEVVVSMFEPNTVPDDVYEFCQGQPDLTVLGVERKGLIEKKISIILV